VNAVRQWRVLAAKGSGAVDILFAARPSGDAMPTTRDAASARMGKERMELGYSNGLRPGYERASPYDVWVEGRYSGFDDDAASLGRDGHVGVLYVGGDYRVAENMMVGAWSSSIGARMPPTFSNRRSTVTAGWPVLTCRCARLRLLGRRRRLRLLRLHAAGDLQRASEL